MMNKKYLGMPHAIVKVGKKYRFLLFEDKREIEPSAITENELIHRGNSPKRLNALIANLKKVKING